MQIETLAFQPRPTRNKPGSFGLTLVDVFQYDLHLALRDHRAKVGIGVQRIADDNLAQPLGQPGQKGVLDAFVHKDAGAVGTDLARAVEVPQDRAAHRIFEIRILKDNQGGFAAQFHRHILDASRRGGIDLAPGGHRAGQRDLVHTGVRDKGVAHVTAALHHIVQSGGQPRLMQDFSHLEGAQRRGFGGFENHRIAAGQRGRAFPAGDLGGVIPCADAHTDAQRLAAGIDPVFAKLDVRAGQRCRHAAEILQRIRARGCIHRDGLLVGFAGVAGFQHAQIVVARPDQIGGPAQDTPAFGAAHRGPGTLGALRGGEGLIHDVRGCAMQCGNHRAADRADHRKGGACGVFDIGAIDEMAGGGLCRIGHQSFSPPAGVCLER